MARFQKGQSGNAGGRPKAFGSVRESCTLLLPKALKRLAELIDSTDEKIALAAIKEALDRAIGKAPVMDHDGGIVSDTKIIVNVPDLTKPSAPAAE